MPIEDPTYRAIAISCICAALRDQNPNVRCAAVEALGKLGIEKYILQLVEVFGDKNDDVRRAVIETLGKMGEQERMSGDQTFNINNVGNLNAGDVPIQGDQIGIQNNTQSQQDFEALLVSFKKFVADVAIQSPVPNTSEFAAQTLTVEAQKLPTQWHNFLQLKHLWNGGKKATIEVGEHFAENNVWGKGAIAFLEGVSEEIQ